LVEDDLRVWLALEGLRYFEDSHVRLYTMSSKDQDGERDFSIQAHLFQCFPAFSKSRYPVESLFVYVVKEY